ncbi:MAG: hypothetical protein IJE60_03325 [Tyzzerella sp.]|nr:hypothetical protein [Tyzzerella sp.]
MISNEGREFCRGIGLLAEHIICMADSFEEPIEKFRKSLFYSPEFEDKGKIIQDNINTANRIRDEVKLISINDLEELHDTHGIAIVEYVDMLSNAVRAEPYDNNEVKFKSDAVVSIMLDIVHREIRDDDTYKKIAEGEINENAQVQLLS